MSIPEGTKAGTWNPIFNGYAQIEIKNKVENSFKSELEAIEAAKKLKIQAAVVKEENGTFSLYHIDDNSGIDSLGEKDNVDMSREGLAAGIVEFVGTDGKVVNDKLSFAAMFDLAKDPKTSPNILERIFKEEEPDSLVNRALASNPNASASILNELAKTDDSPTKIELIKNPKTGSHTLFNILKEAKKNDDFKVKMAFVENPKTTPDLLDLVSQDSQSLFRERVAEHLNTSPNTLLRLAKDTEREVISAVSVNPNTPKEALDILAKDFDPYIRENAIDHPNFNKKPEPVHEPDDDNFSIFKKFLKGKDS